MSNDLAETGSALLSRTSQIVENTSLMKNLAQIATYMAEAKLVPEHLRNRKSDCLLVTIQAYRWGMDPFAVAQKTHVIHGKLGYEGQLVASIINTSGEIDGKLDYEFYSDGDDRGVIVSGRLKGEEEDRTVKADLKEAKTSNERWKKDPDQMLCYYGARKWARRHMPELLMGVYAEDELPSKPQQPERRAESLVKPGDEPETVEAGAEGADEGEVEEPEPEEPEPEEKPKKESKKKASKKKEEPKKEEPKKEDSKSELEDLF